MGRHSYQFGKAKVDDFPNLSEIEDDVSERGIIGTEGNRRGARRIYKGDDYIFFNFVKEIEREYPALNDRNEDVTRKRYQRKVMKVLIRDDGNFISEAKRSVRADEVFEYLFENFNVEFRVRMREELGLDVMRAFYKKSKRIKKVKTKEIGEKEPNPTVADEDRKELVEEAGEKCDSANFSVGHMKESLKDALIIDDFASYSSLPMIKAEDEDGETKSLRESGRLVIRYPDDLDPQDESSAVMSEVRELLEVISDGEDILFNEEDEEE